MNVELMIIGSIIKGVIVGELCEIILIKGGFLKRRCKSLIVVSKLRIVNLIIIRSII